MKKTLLVLVVCAALAKASEAQNWSVGVGTGPFVFGDFLRRTLRTGNETGSGSQTTRLSAATRAGLAVDIERNLSDRFAIRLEGAFTRAPLAVKGSREGGVALDAGTMNVGTFMVPVVFRINRSGAFRFHVMGGPAYAVYDISNRSNTTSTLRPFTGSRARWGAALGGGVGWWLSNRFAIEGQLTDISTTSPFRRNEFASGLGRIQIPRPHNVHTTVGIRYRF
ncbi:MAG TPA: outer membrane beta-barrel protein [Thermoanaerobaculia bacterium]